MRFARSWLLAICGACSFDHGADSANGDAATDDSQAMKDAAVVQMDATGDARLCFGSFINICLTTPPDSDLSVDVDRDVNTDTGCPFVFSQSTGQTLCGVVARNITINARLRGNGPRPLLVLATETLTINAGGMIDVGSYRDSVDVIGAGAASGSTQCGSPSAGSGDNGGGEVGGGGGAGGSFVGKGGGGARGLNNAGGNGGNAANPSGTPSYMRGGCRGTNGGSGNGNAVGSGGYGGGAVLVIAGTSLVNAGHIRAGGEGGYGGGPSSGGGGGGAGGMIVLDATTIMNSGILNANGGGGGEGGGMGGGDVGSSAYYGTTAAVGGDFNMNGGNGGLGSWASTLTGGGGSTGTNGGGAGGGGAGAIRIYPAQAVGGTVSPNPS